MEYGLRADAVLARSQSERNALWEIRDDVLEFFKLGPIIPFDISITLDKMEGFVAAIRAGMDTVGEPICIVFGHLGDRNLHLILGPKIPEEFDHEALSTLLCSAIRAPYQRSMVLAAPSGNNCSAVAA
jgi:FAD/FMN-containing dehydrogenase